MCRVGCPNEPGSLSHYNECPLLYDMFRPFWGQATVLPRITKVFLRSLQFGIVVMGSLMHLYMLIISTVEASKILENLVIA